jgi:hypothetical protein
MEKVELPEVTLKTVVSNELVCVWTSPISVRHDLVGVSSVSGRLVSLLVAVSSAHCVCETPLKAV